MDSSGESAQRFAWQMFSRPPAFWSLTAVASNGSETSLRERHLLIRSEIQFTPDLLQCVCNREDALALSYYRLEDESPYVKKERFLCSTGEGADSLQ